MNTPQNDPFSTARNREWLGDFRQDPGPVRDSFAIPSETLAAYRDKLPPTIVELWETDGLGSLYNGQVWMCDPAEFAPLSQLLFRGDPDLHPDRTHIYAYSVFGAVVFWNEDFNSGEASMVRGVVSCGGLTTDRPRINVNLSALSALESWMNDPHAADEQDEDGKWLFARAKKALGPAGYGECYGLAPILPLGGAWRLENLRRVRALEHFLILAQAQAFVLRDYRSRPNRDVRVIGG